MTSLKTELTCEDRDHPNKQNEIRWKICSYSVSSRKGKKQIVVSAKLCTVEAHEKYG